MRIRYLFLSIRGQVQLYSRLMYYTFSLFFVCRYIVGYLYLYFIYIVDALILDLV